MVQIEHRHRKRHSLMGDIWKDTYKEHGAHSISNDEQRQAQERNRLTDVELLHHVWQASGVDS